MITDLLPHNRKAYQNIMKAFETSDRTCVVHPTGTGKSYLIAAVSESFGRVLVMAPGTVVFDNVKRITKWHKGIDFMTYALLNSRGLEDHYDMIVLDEFHRAGATEWSKAVKEALEQNGGKVLGTSATPIRYLDEGRDMSIELFDGNIASQMTIGEAWSRNILPIPTYVTGLFDFRQTAEEVRERIKKAKRLKDKSERLRMLAKIELDWQTSNGMPQVIRRHITNDMKRIIIFCGNVEHLEAMTKTILDWFNEAGLKVADLYRLHHQMSENEKTEAMNGFQQDTDQGIKIILAVNMLNEGVHIPRVDAVIMLRTTCSRIIYMQQLGRCLTAANTARPVVLDMVDNISGANVIGDIKEDFDQAERKRYEHTGEHEKIMRQFSITDYTQGIRQIIEKLTEGTARFITLSERLENIEQFVKEHGRLPIESEREAYRDWEILLRYKDREPRVYELMELYPRRKTSDVIAEEYVKFCKEHNRLPFGKNIEGERALWTYMKRHREEMLTNYPEVKEQFEKYYRWRDRSRERLQSLVEFYKEYHRLPGNSDTQKKNYTYIVKHGLLDKFNELIEPYKPKIESKPKSEPKPLGRTIDQLIAEVTTFCEKHGRLPQSKDKCKAGSAWLRLRYTEHHPKAFELAKKYGANLSTWEKHLPKLEAFVKAEGRMPSRKKDSLYQVWRNIRKDHKDDPRVQAIRAMSKYDELGRPIGDS